MKKITLENYKEVLDIDHIKWEDISRYWKLEESFIRKFEHNVDWFYISIHQKLSEDFIREFKDKVNWCWISKHQKLSGKFIKEFQNKVAWIYISNYQNLSKKIIKEFKDNIVDYKLLKSVHYCGDENRVICINVDKPEIIHIGCFKGTKEEAIKAVSEKYDGKAKKKYISQIEECFNY